MTIAIAIAIPDGALLMTDGRRSSLDNSNEIVTDTATKIHQLTNNLSVATYGLEPVTRCCLEVIQREAQPDWNCSSYLLRLSIYLPEVFTELKSQLLPQLDHTDPNIFSGFVLAGHDQGHPFIGRLLFHGETQIAADIIRKPGFGAILGGFSCDAYNILQRNIENHPDISHEKENDYGRTEEEALKDVLTKTIRDVSKHEPSVGGAISFTLLRHQHETQSGTIKNPDS